MTNNLKDCISQWTDFLYYYPNKTSRALNESEWNDDVGKGIKEGILDTVHNHLKQALDSYADKISDIDLSDFENVLTEVERHLEDKSIID